MVIKVNGVHKIFQEVHAEQTVVWHPVPLVFDDAGIEIFLGFGADGDRVKFNNIRFDHLAASHLNKALPGFFQGKMPGDLLMQGNIGRPCIEEQICFNGDVFMDQRSRHNDMIPMDGNWGFGGLCGCSIFLEGGRRKSLMGYRFKLDYFDLAGSIRRLDIGHMTDAVFIGPAVDRLSIWGCCGQAAESQEKYTYWDFEHMDITVNPFVI